MTSSAQAATIGTGTPESDDADLTPKQSGEKKADLAGRSPGQLMWLRFKRDRTGVISAFVVLFFFLIAACAPLISMVYGKDPYTKYGLDQGLLDSFGDPIAANGGISAEHWFGIEPDLGRDVFMYLIYGIRTSLYVAVVITILSVVIGVVIGMVGGYFGGKVDYWLGRVTDLALGFPSQLFLIASMPVVIAVFVDDSDETPTYIRVLAIIIVSTALGWMGMSRLVRSAALTVREREFIEAAKVSGASPGRIIRKELLPNLVTPILVQGTFMLPSAVLSVAFLSFVGAGFLEPTPDWGRMFRIAGQEFQTNPTYMWFPGIAMVIFIVAFNLLGDSVRDAFDPKSGR